MSIDMIILLFLLALIPAFIASNKGRSFILWYIYGVALLIVAIPHSLIISKTQIQKDKELSASGYTECPFCKEPVKVGAIVCPHCRRELPVHPDPAMTNKIKCPTCGFMSPDSEKLCPRCHNLLH
jgi:hypothetical protein